MTLLHDRKSTVRSERARYTVIPDGDDSPRIAPVVYFGATLTSGHASLSDYLTPDEADELAGALSEGARIARGTALDSGLTAKDSSPEHSPVLDGSKR